MSNLRGVSIERGPLLAWLPDPAGGSRPASRAPATSSGDQSTPRKQILSDLLRWEGDVHHLYLDTRGFVTVGVGNLVKSAASATQLPFVDKSTGAPATARQIADEFRTVSQQPIGRQAAAYAPATNLRLSEETVRSLAADRLDTEFLPGLRRLFPRFDDFPEGAQRALVDMAYNVGVDGLGRFHHLRAACESCDWRAAAADCHRRGCRAERNDWTRQRFLDAAASTPPTA